MRAMAEAAKSLGILFSFALTMGASAALAEGAGGPCTGPAAHEAARQPAPMNLKEAATATGVLARMMEATKLAGLDDPEIEVGPLTLLAPSDDAFNALPQEVRDRLLAPENRAILTDLLLYHAIPGLYPTERLLNARVRNYTIQAIDGSFVRIENAQITGNQSGGVFGDRGAVYKVFGTNVSDNGGQGAFMRASTLQVSPQFGIPANFANNTGPGVQLASLSYATVDATFLNNGGAYPEGVDCSPSAVLRAIPALIGKSNPNCGDQ